MKNLRKITATLLVAILIFLSCETLAAPLTGDGISFVGVVENVTEKIVSLDVRAFYSTPATNWNFRVKFDNTIVELCDPAGADVTGMETKAFEGALSTFASGALADVRSTDANEGWLKPIAGTDFGGSNTEGFFTMLAPLNTTLNSTLKASYGIVDNKLPAPANLPVPSDYLPIGKIYFKVKSGYTLADVQPALFSIYPDPTKPSISSTGASIRETTTTITTNNAFSTPVTGHVSINGTTEPFAPRVGDLLTGAYIDGNANNYEFVWTRGTETLATDTNTYTVTEDDVGHTLTLFVEGRGDYLGSVSMTTLTVTPLGETVSGYVAYDGGIGTGYVDIVLMQDTTIVYSTMTEAGPSGTGLYYEIPYVLPGTYTLKASRLGHLSAFITDLSVIDYYPARVGTALSLKSGDVTDDGVIDYEDYVTFLSSYGTATPVCNFTGSGTVDYEDYVLFLGNYGAVSQNVVYVEATPAP